MEFTPSASSRGKKPITKAQLKKLREQYARANTIVATTSELEKIQKEREAQSLQKTIDDAFDY